MMVYIIYAIILVIFIDTFAQLPIISPFAQQLGATPLLIGLAVGMYSFSNTFGNLLAGIWTDKTGAKRVLYVGLGVTGIVLILHVFIQTPTQLVLARFAHGFTAGFAVPAAFTYLSNQSKQAKHGKSMALSGAVVGVAAIIGPAFGGVMTASAGIKWVFLITGILMLIAAILALFLPQPTVSKKLDSVDTGRSMFALLKDIPLFYSYFGSFALMFAQGVLAYMLPLKVEVLNYGNDVSGLLLSTFAFTAILIFILPTNRLYDRFAHENTLTVGLFILGFGMFLLSLTSQLPLLYGAMVIYGIGFAFIFPSLNALIAQHTNSSDRGKAFGLFYAFFSLGVVVGSTVIGAFEVSANGAFVIGAMVVFISSIILILLIQRQKKTNRTIT